jgi:multicomponent Na+:H+ antiporter subunit C
MQALATDLELLQTVLYSGAFGLVLLGLYAVASCRHLVRILLGLTLLEGGVNLFLVAVGFRAAAVAPIVTPGAQALPMVDPLPQALILTAIVIGVGVLALALALTVRVFEVHGTLDVRALAQRLTQAGEGTPEQPSSAPPVSVTREAS